MTTDEQQWPNPLTRTAPAWQNLTLTLQGPNNGPFTRERFTDEQRSYFIGLCEAGWEMVGMTTLANGWLALGFKRPWPVDQPDMEPAHVGVYI